MKQRLCFSDVQHAGRQCLGGWIRRILPLSFVLVLLSSQLGAQTPVTIRGVVTDEKSAPVVGATVLVKGQTTGTATDRNGKFMLKVKPGTTLEIRMLGYQTQEVKVQGNKTNLTIVLKDDVQHIEDITVNVAYGTALKKDLTGSVGIVNMGDLNKAPVVNFDQALQGRIAGMQMSSADGQPGSEMNVVIRGANSLTQDNSPLYVVDGFPMEDFASSSLNSSDIESISVLKDASSTALYGSRGANGVIIITTKQGRAGKPTVRYNGSFSIQEANNRMEMMSPYDYVIYQIERSPSNFNRYLTNAGRTLDDYRNMEALDWQDMIFRTAPMHKHDISVSGGTEQTTYNISGSIVSQDGVILNSGYEKYSGRISINQTFNRNTKLRVTASYLGDKTYGQTASEALSSSNSFATYLMYRTWGSRPFYISDDANVDDLFDEDSGTYSIMNPVISSKNEYRVKKTEHFNANAYFEWKFLKYLTLKINGGYNIRTSMDEKFNNSKTYGGYTSTYNSRGINGSYDNWKRSTWVNENSLLFWRRFNDRHRLDAVLVYSMQGSKVQQYGFSAEHIPIESLGMSGLNDGLPYSSRAKISDSGLMSFLGRVNYDYKKRYYVTASFRADGSSKFAPGHKWGYFPSGALSWRFSEEKLIKKLKFIDNGKLRLSYGVSGNNRVGDYDTYPALSLSDYYTVTSGNPIAAATPNSIGNKELTWETTKEWDLGLDLSLFRERVNLTVDLYRKDTEDLLMKANLPYSSGYTTVYRNVGNIRNDGIEFTLSTTNVRTRNFTWTSDFNISFNRGRVLELAEGEEAILSKVNLTYTFNSTYLYIAQKGGPLASFYGYQWDGVYHYDDFNVVDGKYVLRSNVATNGTERSTIKPGDVKYVDQNGDYVVDDRDMVIIGRCMPIHTGGFNNNFTYKNLSLNVFFQWSYGNDIMNANRIFFDGNSSGQNVNQFRTYKDRWTPENPDSNIPSVTGQGPAGIYSSRTIEDGSFLRLKTLQLSYAFPVRWIRKIGLKELSVYVSGQNLWTWTNYSGMDPEVSTRHSTLTPGFDYSAYARNRIYSVGLNVTF